MKLASIINQYYDAFMEKYAGTALPGHLKALNAICRCRTPDSGEVYVQCPDCHHGQWQPLSCGHRNCPKCQNHEASQWIKKKGKYLFNEFALAKVFRARFLEALKAAGLSIPKNIPPKWVVDCKHAGNGISALKYLSRYLYRGVISEKNIVSNQNGRVTFKYIESKTGKPRYRTLNGEDFLDLIMKHVLPKGFRRVRDYGFLHGNAKKLLGLVQLILHVVIKGIEQRPRPAFKCPCCGASMVIVGVIVGFRYAKWKAG